MWISSKGSGKSTFARKILQSYESQGKRGIICSADDFFIDTRGNYMWDGSRLSEAHEFCKQKSERHMNMVSSYHTKFRTIRLTHFSLAARTNYRQVRSSVMQIIVILKFEAKIRQIWLEVYLYHSDMYILNNYVLNDRKNFQPLSCSLHICPRKLVIIRSQEYFLQYFSLLIWAG